METGVETCLLAQPVARPDSPEIWTVDLWSRLAIHDGRSHGRLEIITRRVFQFPKILDVECDWRSPQVLDSEPQHVVALRTGQRSSHLTDNSFEQPR